MVPGDILLLDEKKHSLPCDAILIDGGCVVDEGMLTGITLHFDLSFVSMQVFALSLELCFYQF